MLKCCHVHDFFSDGLVTAFEGGLFQILVHNKEYKIVFLKQTMQKSWRFRLILFEFQLFEDVAAEFIIIDFGFMTLLEE